MGSLNSTPEMPRQFPQTRWSVVLAAGRRAAPESAAALEVLCRDYWFPLYSYVRRCGHTPQDAEDLTQEFFRRLLEKRWLDSADPARGKLRTFLITMLKRFMGHEWRRASAQRRGGGATVISLDLALAESRLGAEPEGGTNPETAYDRQWALTLLELAVERLRTEFAAAGRPEDFESLKGCLMAERGGIDYAGLAAALGTSEGAARVAAHRLRKRFREVYRAELAQTLGAEADLEEELRHLAAALARQV
jgi:RNA polymerase sigma-70 factor (ECF subfamily)